MLLSEARHPTARPMTVVAAVRTFMDNLKPGANIFPELIDDVTGKGIVPIVRIRAQVNLAKRRRDIMTRTIDQKLYIFWYKD